MIKKKYEHYRSRNFNKSLRNDKVFEWPKVFIFFKKINKNIIVHSYIGPIAERKILML
jgi:hypothetical protein